MSDLVPTRSAHCLSSLDCTRDFKFFDSLLLTSLDYFAMPISALDSRLFKDLFGTAEIRTVFDDGTYTRYMIGVEVALARAQSKTGVIPADAGETLAKHFEHENFQ